MADLNWCSRVAGVHLQHWAESPLNTTFRTGGRPASVVNGAGFVSEKIKGSSRVPLLWCFARCAGPRRSHNGGLDSSLSFLLWLVIISGAPTSPGGGLRDSFDRQS